MENFENLNGALVLVRPDHNQDSGGQQGKIGIVTYARSSEDIHVGLLNGTEGKYEGNDLFQVKDKKEILHELMTNGSSLELEDYKAMYKIMLLEDRGTSTAKVNALEIAAQRPSIWDKVLNNAVPAQTIEITKSYGR